MAATAGEPGRSQPGWPEAALRTGLSLLATDDFTGMRIVDVGAHRGETLSSIVAHVAGPVEYIALEPNPEAFSDLQAAIGSLQRPDINVSAVMGAAGSNPGHASFFVTRESAVSGFLSPAEGLSERVPTGDHEVTSSIEVEVYTIDDIMAASRVSRLELLKVDAEGYDLEVLRGARAALGDGLIDVVVCECFFVNYRAGQAFFWDIATFMHELGYFFVNLFDTRETSQGRLYTGNGLWVSESLARARSFL